MTGGLDPSLTYSSCWGLPASIQTMIGAVPVEYVPEYFWQIMMMHNEIPYSTHEFPEEPIRRLEAYQKDVSSAVGWLLGLPDRRVCAYTVGHAWHLASMLTHPAPPSFTRVRARRWRRGRSGRR